MCETCCCQCLSQGDHDIAEVGQCGRDLADVIHGDLDLTLQIANQLLTLQLTPQQQEKRELHLSRMTLEQQQTFLQQQHHILAKLQLRVDPNMAAQATPLQVKGFVRKVAFIHVSVLFSQAFMRS